MSSKNEKKPGIKWREAALLPILLLLALFAGIAWGTNQRIYGQRQPNFTSFSTGELGVSLLFDTLQHMGGRLDVLYRPVGDSVNTNDAVVIVQPSNPRLNSELAVEILIWVERGGRLIYLENSQSNFLDRMLRGERYTSFGGFRWYRVGLGEVVTGQANMVVNANLMQNPVYGESLAFILTSWEPGRIYFAEYYHGFHQTDGIFMQLPAWLQLTAIQIIITAVALVWHFGKRFGRPVTMYEEIERGENEQVFTLARLYKQADRR